ncbi:MAG: late competence development ComFB family protein [Lachnospiraceae bacterium]|nr:late competence development ComFB family protein [Lachnospiraceae bacterium]
MEGLTNMMEETVLTKIDQLWQTTDFCKCSQCRIDIAAFALNRLPPRYVHSLAGELIHKFDASTIQMDAEITACVYNAIVRIGEDPNHDIEKVSC